MVCIDRRPPAAAARDPGARSERGVVLVPGGARAAAGVRRRSRTRSPSCGPRAAPPSRWLGTDRSRCVGRRAGPGRRVAERLLGARDDPAPVGAGDAVVPRGRQRLAPAAPRRRRGTSTSARRLRRRAGAALRARRPRGARRRSTSTLAARAVGRRRPRCCAGSARCSGWRRARRGGLRRRAVRRAVLGDEVDMRVLIGAERPRHRAGPRATTSSTASCTRATPPAGALAAGEHGQHPRRRRHRRVRPERRRSTTPPTSGSSTSLRRPRRRDRGRCRHGPRRGLPARPSSRSCWSAGAREVPPAAARGRAGRGADGHRAAAEHLEEARDAARRRARARARLAPRRPGRSSASGWSTAAPPGPVARAGRTCCATSSTRASPTSSTPPWSRGSSAASTPRITDGAPARRTPGAAPLLEEDGTLLARWLVRS